MNLVLLGGNSVVNKQWLSDFSSVLKPNFESTYTHHYRHWEAGAEFIDLNFELQALSVAINPKQPYVVVAKSAGVLVTLKGVAEKVLTPHKCIFIGTPVHWAKEHNFAIDAWLSNYLLPTLFIQQSHDPAMSFGDLKQYLDQENIKNCQLIELPGDDHVYGNFDQLKKRVIAFKSKINL